MIQFPQIDPIIVSFGHLAISWYSLSYVCGILLGWFYASKLTKEFSIPISKELREKFISYAIIGIIVGGRLGYVFLYDPIRFMNNPVDILKTYEGGMSFHGGILGIATATLLFCYIYKIAFFTLGDLLAMVAPIGIFLGRIANFINAELYGRVTDVKWGIIFPHSDGLARHPSQIYEALLEGLLPLIIMFLNRHKILRQKRMASGIFLILYSTARIFVECFREPDIQLGFILPSITMGQLLCLPMLILGIYFFITRKQ